MIPYYGDRFRHGTCATHCVDCGRCMEADEPYTTEHHGDSWFDVCDVCTSRYGDNSDERRPPGGAA